jgi:glucarate dehydratase
LNEFPTVSAMRVIPVAGQDSMLLNLSGAHAPVFIRNLVVLTDNAGRTGVGEVPGGEAIRQTLEQSIPMVVGQPVSDFGPVKRMIEQRFSALDAGGRASRPSTSGSRSMR